MLGYVTNTKGNTVSVSYTIKGNDSYLILAANIYQGTITLSGTDEFETMTSVNIDCSYNKGYVNVYKVAGKKGTTLTLSKSAANSKACIIELG